MQFTIRAASAAVASAALVLTASVGVIGSRSDGSHRTVASIGRPAGRHTHAAHGQQRAIVHVAPDAHLTFASIHHPMDTATCRRRFHFRCYGPKQIEAAYGVKKLAEKGITGKGETIAIVDSFGSPTIRHDLGVFDETYKLPAPPSLRVVHPAGKTPKAKRNNHPGWAGETTLDVEYAHAMAPGAKILLVETPTSENEGTSGFPDIVKAEKQVIRHDHPAVISQSFSATEETFPTRKSLVRLRSAYKLADKRHVTVLAAAGDSGAADVDNKSHFYLHPVTSWPDSDPLVTGIGGTKLTLGKHGNRLRSDVVWNDTDNRAVNRYFGAPTPDPDAGGGGKSIIFNRPGFQNVETSVVGNRRGVPDISMSAACSGQVEIYSSFVGAPTGWSLACGTSEATPIFAGVVALTAQANKGTPLGDINPALYAMSTTGSAGIDDVTKGNTTVSFRKNGKLHTIHGARATKGYDLASGVGTVNSDTFVYDLRSMVRYLSRVHGRGQSR